MKDRTDVAFGIGFIGLASMFGVLRFAIAPKIFAGMNNFLAEWAGFVGVPMIGFGFARMNGTFPDVLEFDPHFPYFLVILLFLLGNIIKDPTPICLISMGCLLHSEGGLSNLKACAAVALFLVSGLWYSSNKFGTYFGIRRVNIFHYCCGISMVLFAYAL